MGIVVRRLAGLPAGGMARLLRAMSPAELQALETDWGEWAHAGQAAPAGDWRTWVLMAGRGFGKTRAGSEWVHAQVRAAEAAGRRDMRIALVAATVEEARRVMVEGVSGLLATARHANEAPVFEASLRRVIWPGGAEATLFSGAHPDGLRGPEHDLGWCDELAKWRHPAATWDMLQLGLRRGDLPRALVTTTPKAGLGALTRLLAEPDTIATGGASWLNPHVSTAWVAAMQRRFAGARLGAQELEGKLIEDLEGSLWPAGLIAASRGVAPERGALVRVVVGVDPPASAGGVCGIVACGLDAAGMAYVLADRSAGGCSPESWARRVVATVEAHDADRVVVETNQGGEMVSAVLRSVDAVLPIKAVTARQGKVARAEPVAALFEAGRVTLCGVLPALEAELAGMVAGGYVGEGRSPDRADAMVWALWALLIRSGGAPQVRGT